MCVKPLYFDEFSHKISMQLPILYFKGSQVEFSKFLKVVFILANSAGPDEIQLYPFRGFQYTKG